MVSEYQGEGAMGQDLSAERRLLPAEIDTANLATVEAPLKKEPPVSEMPTSDATDLSDKLICHVLAPLIGADGDLVSSNAVNPGPPAQQPGYSETNGSSHIQPLRADQGSVTNTVTASGQQTENPASGDFSDQQPSMALVADNEQQVEKPASGDLSNNQPRMAHVPDKEQEVMVNDTTALISGPVPSLSSDSTLTEIGEDLETDQEQPRADPKTGPSMRPARPLRAAASKLRSYKEIPSDGDPADQTMAVQSHETVGPSRNQPKQQTRTSKSTTKKRSADEAIAEADMKKAKRVKPRAQKQDAKQAKSDSATQQVPDHKPDVRNVKTGSKKPAQPGRKTKLSGPKATAVAPTAAAQSSRKLNAASTKGRMDASRVDLTQPHPTSDKRIEVEVEAVSGDSDISNDSDSEEEQRLCDCIDLLSGGGSYKFNPSLGEDSEWISKFVLRTEDIFMELFQSEESEQKFEDNHQACCRQLLMAFRDPIDLMLGTSDSNDVEETYKRLLACTTLGSGGFFVWLFAQSCFLAFLTLRVFGNKNAMKDIGFEAFEDGEVVAKYHTHLEKTGNLRSHVIFHLQADTFLAPKKALVHRMEWRQYLSDCLGGDQVKLQIRQLASKLVSEFLVAFDCLLPAASPEVHKDQEYWRERLVAQTENAICIRAKMRLSSFRYLFVWVSCSSAFDPSKMTTVTGSAGLGDPRMNEVRHGRSPYVLVEHPKEENTYSREAREFKSGDFLPRAMLVKAEVVRFDRHVYED